jgi:GntR family transcriptional regulator, transcriptional repressor for pyruvate dehydrogenase complex
MNAGLPGKIFDDMQNDIINGIYPVGSKLPPERDLSRKYRASRFAVREAIAMLAQGGFVETQPQSGTYIRDFQRDGSLETLVRILRIRRTIERETLDSLLKFRFTTETAAASEAALRAGESDIACLKRNLERKREHLKDIPVLIQCDFDFHYTVIALSGDIISRLVFKSFEPIYSFFTEFFYSLRGGAEMSLKLNEKLLRAMARRDPEASRKAMGEVLRYAERRVKDAIGKGGPVIQL